MRVIAVYVHFQLVLLLTSLIHTQSIGRGIVSLSLFSIKSKSIRRQQKNETISIGDDGNDVSNSSVAIQNTAHDASNKINLAAVDSSSTDISDDVINQKQTTFIASLQMVLSIVSMVLSRVIFKLNFKDKNTVKMCRLIFCGYLLLSQLFYFLLSFKVNDNAFFSSIFLIDTMLDDISMIKKTSSIMQVIIIIIIIIIIR
jgi:hypothetical protein